MTFCTNIKEIGDRVRFDPITHTFACGVDKVRIKWSNYSKTFTNKRIVATN